MERSSVVCCAHYAPFTVPVACVVILRVALISGHYIRWRLITLNLIETSDTIQFSIYLSLETNQPTPVRTHERHQKAAANKTRNEMKRQKSE